MASELPEYVSDEEDEMPTAQVVGGGHARVGGASATFADFCLKPQITKAITAAGFEQPSKIQEEAIPEAHAGNDIIAQAKSGMGKTAVFVLVTLDRYDPSENPGHVYCVVVEPTKELVQQVVQGAPVTTIDARELSSLGRSFGAILADVPCTGLGALRRRPEVRWRRSVADLKALVVLQTEIIDSAINSLQPGGIFGYATCSPHLSETRIAVSEALKRHPDMEQMDVSKYLHPDLQSTAVDRGNMPLWTHKHNTDAMFLSVMRKRN